MDKFTIMLLAGLLVLVIGLGILSDFSLKDFKATMKHNRPGGFLLTVIGLALVVAGFLGTIGWLGAKPEGQATPTSGPPTPSTSPSGTTPSESKTSTKPGIPSSPATSATPKLSVTLTKPVEGATVPLSGTVVSGVINGDRDGYSFWLFTNSEGGWYLDDVIEPSRSGSFQVNSGQIGDKSENGKGFTMEVLASKGKATDVIKKQRPNKDGDIVFSTRPAQRLDSRGVVRR